MRSPASIERRKARQRARYRERRAYIHEYLGGACADCGKQEPEVFLEVDHDDPRSKDGDVMQVHWSAKLERLHEELGHVSLRCHGCHLEKTRREKAREGHDDGAEAPPF